MRLLEFSPQRMKQARLGKGWSQSDAARAVNTREQQITRYETGQNVPNANFVARYAQVTGQDLEFFYTEAEAAEDEDDSSMPSLDELLSQRVEYLVAQRLKALA